MLKKTTFNLEDLINILEKERKKVDEVQADLLCLIEVLKKVKTKDKLLFNLPSAKALAGSDPCCGMCREEEGG